MNKLIEPLLDRVVLLPIKEEVSSGGLFWGEDVQEKLVRCATVIAIGPGKLAVHEGKAVSIPLGLKVGDVVYINPHSGMKIRLSDDKEYLLMKEDEVLGKEVSVESAE